MKQEEPESFGRRVMTRIRSYLFEDAQLKLLALLIVTVIWLSVAGQTRNAPVKIHNVDVTLENVPPQLAVTSTDPTQVSVTITGPEDELRELRFEVATQSSDLIAIANLNDLKEGVQLARLSVRGLPDGVTLLRVDPDTVRVTLDPIRTREVPVEPRFAGSLPEGYKLTGAYTEPATVTLSGPESVISKIDKVTTTTVSLNNRYGSFAEPVDIDITGTDVLVRDRPILHVTIQEDIGTRTFTVPITVQGSDGGQVEPQSVMVTLKGPVPALNSLAPTDVAATIAPSGGAARQNIVPQIQISGPNAPSLEVEKVQPQSVRWRR